jgi:hypothetical protein
LGIKSSINLILPFASQHRGGYNLAPRKGALIMYQKNTNGAISILVGVLLAMALGVEYLYAIIKMLEVG